MMPFRQTDAVQYAAMPARLVSAALWMLLSLTSVPGFSDATDPGAEQALDEQQDPAEASDDWDDDWDEDWGDSQWDEETSPWRWTGFVEGALGTRVEEAHPQAGDRSLGEVRARIETDHQSTHWRVLFKGELLYDQVGDHNGAHLRELALGFSPLSKLDVRAGRQVLTWGTGDLLFLNDLFPKDFESFFAGRDDEYLKAPADALRLTTYSDWLNADFVYAPDFEPDIYLNGERFSLFSPGAGANVSPDPPLAALAPDGDEWALRLYRTLGSVEYAAYGYDGFFKQPTALNSAGVPTFAPMRAIGASARWPGLGGLLNVETSYYDSKQDPDGDDPFIPNSQLRFLLGHERELISNLNLGLQYYVEYISDHRELIAASPNPEFEPDSWRQLVTSRLTFRTQQDRVIWSLHAFVSPDDHDWHLRPEVNWRYSDQWQFAAGARLFGGEQSTFFGQLKQNDSLFLRVRRYF